MDPISDKEQRREALRARLEMLECIRLREIAAMTDEVALRRIETLGTAEEPWRESRAWSGLVEQQAIFHRRKKI